MFKNVYGELSEMAKSKSKLEKKVQGTRRKKQKKVSQKNAGLNPRKFSKVKQEFHDFDYIKLLSPKEKQFLSDFTWEYLGANLTEAKYHKTKKARKDVFDANNARQRDIYSQRRAEGRLFSMTPEVAAWHSENNWYEPDIEPNLQQNEYLTESEFLDLLKNGAIIPDSLVIFYKKLYKLD